MKKILLALVFLITLANAQVITPVLGGTQFTLPNSTTYFYSCNTEIYATIDAQDRARFYNKVGGQVFGAYYFYDISIDGDTLLSKTDFLQAINELPCFSAFEICGEVINAGLDSGEVIGNFLYLFQGNDTVIVDVSNLADTSLWGISAGKLQPKNEVPLKVSYVNTTLGWDSLIVGQFLFPYYGVAEIIGSFKYINGMFDLSPLQSNKMVITAINTSTQNTIAVDSTSFEMFTKISNANYAKILGDTSEIELSFNDSISIGLDANSIGLRGIKEYADDASADADTTLPSYAIDGKYGLYKLTGDRTLYLKP